MTKAHSEFRKLVPAIHISYHMYLACNVHPGALIHHSHWFIYDNKQLKEQLYTRRDSGLRCLATLQKNKAPQGTHNPMAVKFLCKVPVSSDNT